MKEKQEPRITFYAAECMEFPDHWDLYENLTLEEAVKAYQKILKKRSCCGPGIGFVLYDEKIPDYSDIHWPLYDGEINHAEIDLIQAYREHPLVKQAIQDMEKHIPKIEKRKTNRRLER